MVQELPDVTSASGAIVSTVVHGDFIGHAAQIGRHPVGKRRPDAVAHVNVIAVDGDPALRIDFHPAERTVRAGAVILVGAGHAGADSDPALLPARFVHGALLPDRVTLELVENLRRADRINVWDCPSWSCRRS